MQERLLRLRPRLEVRLTRKPSMQLGWQLVKRLRQGVAQKLMLRRQQLRLPRLRVHQRMRRRRSLARQLVLRLPITEGMLMMLVRLPRPLARLLEDRRRHKRKLLNMLSMMLLRLWRMMH